MCDADACLALDDDQCTRLGVDVKSTPRLTSKALQLEVREPSWGLAVHVVDIESNSSVDDSRKRVIWLARGSRVSAFSLLLNNRTILISVGQAR